MSIIPTSELIEKLKKGDRRILGKAITLVENDGEGKVELLDYAYRTMREDCLVLGITGAGGAGKSTLIDKIILAYRNQGKTVGVIAVDPTSPYTGGAVLGDRVRMGMHSTDTGVFIRSLGSRGALGGISQASKDALYLYKSFGFDVILLESLGVGQAETEINDFVDVTVVVLVPGNGDNIQMAKAGIQEIADVFVINKADKPEAETVYIQLITSFDNLPENLRPYVVKTVATENRGLDELLKCIDLALKRQLPNRFRKKKERVKCEIASGVRRRFDEVLSLRVQDMLVPVLVGNLTPFEASKQVSSKIRVEE